MKRSVMGRVAMAAALLVAVSAMVSADGGTWVSNSGQRVHVGGHDAMFMAGGTETSLDELVDGETRVFGMGERRITASRRGDEITISRGESAGKSALDLTCKVGSDSCKVITFDDDAERVMVMIQKSRTCDNGVGDCDDVDVMAMVGEHGDNRFVEASVGEHGEHIVRIHQTVRCDGDGDCEETENIHGGNGELAEVIIQRIGDGSPLPDGLAEMVFVHGDSKTTLRCTEGDTTMRVEPEEADDVFLCPKHSTPLEKIKHAPRKMRRIKVDRDD